MSLVGRPFRRFALVPKLCLGMTLSWKLCFHSGSETEFRGQVRSQTEFGNEGLFGNEDQKLITRSHETPI
jgi:hypothetical protein